MFIVAPFMCAVMATFAQYYAVFYVTPTANFYWLAMVSVGALAPRYTYEFFSAKWNN